MTDSPFAFQDEDQIVAETTESEAGSRRTLLALGGLVVVAAAVGAFFLLGGDPVEEEAFALPPRAPSVPAAAPVVPEVVAAPAAADPARSGHNPFKALVLVPAAAPVTVTPTTTTPTTAAAPAGATVVTSKTTGGTTAPAGTAPAGTTAVAPAPATTSKIMLVSVSEDGITGTFMLDGKELTGKKGDVIGGKVKIKDFLVNSEGQWSVILQVGDGMPFGIYEDEETPIP